MVFVSVGTQKQDFSRIFKLVEQSKSLENETIIAQSGYTNYKSDKITNIAFMKEEDMIAYMKEASMVICHGGVGTIFNALYQKKKILVVPRLAKYKEHSNDHQLEICAQLQEKGYIYYVNDDDDFDENIEKLKQTKMQEYMIDEGYLAILRKEI